MANCISRKKRLAKIINKSDTPAFLVTNKNNIRYLTGFVCSYGYLLCRKDEYTLLTDSRYTNDARTYKSIDKIVEVKPSGVFRKLAEILREENIRTIGFEPNDIAFSEYDQLRQNLKGISLNPTTQFVEELRIIKDEGEIELIKKSSKVMDAAFKKILGFMKPGITEADIRAHLESEMILKGIEKISFETIVASGPRGAFAHGKPSAKKIKHGEFIVIDFGACSDGYHSDMTRTIFCGKPTIEDKRRYNAVYEAQRKALMSAKAGVKASLPDEVARDVLKKYELDIYFTHGLGHGVGLDVHEEPRISQTGTKILKKSMVFTIEPGIYIEGWGGIRIEDTVYLNENGIAVPITKSTKSLISI